MSPLPIRKNSDNPEMIHQKLDNTIADQSFFNVSPLIEYIFKSQNNNEDSKAIKNLWLHSSSLGGNTIQIGEKVDKKSLKSLETKGLISGVGNQYKLTERGSKLLRDAILNDEKSSLTKKASKKMMAKNSYDFGDFVLVKVHDAKKFGSRYVNVKKEVFSNKKIKPIAIEDYKINTKKENGDYKNISEYSDQELIHCLHLAKKIISNSHKIIVSGNQMNSVPIEKIKDFSFQILKELNSRNDE